MGLCLHVVLKPDGSWGPCGDFRCLNNATVPDKYPVANIWDFTNNVAGSHVFSTLDLVKGYFQVEMFPEDIPKTAIITPFGLELQCFLGLVNFYRRFLRGAAGFLLPLADAL